MKGYYIRPSRVTPSVYYKNQLTETIMDIRGRSCPENPRSFYAYLFRSLNEFESSDSKTLKVNMAFEYFNTSSAKCLFNFMDRLQKLEDGGKDVIVNWFYEHDDDDMQEAGDDFSCFFDFEFKFVAIPEIRVVGELREDQSLAA